MIKMLQQTITNIFETNKRIESLNKEIGDIKKSQMEIPELKNTITKTKSSGSRINSGMEDRAKNQ